MNLEDLFREATITGVTQHRRMNFPAPSRASKRTNLGYFYTVPWTKAEVLSYRAIGGWFEKNRHDFADREAAIAAGVRKEEVA